jgi:hypothetical protein
MHIHLQSRRGQRTGHLSAIKYTQLSIIWDNGGDGTHDQSKTQLRQILLKKLQYLQNTIGLPVFKFI